MNALANSQAEELKKFLEKGYGPGQSPVRVARYTGQEKTQQREEIRNHPPDVLLTNYMMLELLLTRRKDRALVQAAQGLKFLVFDELHTYRGRQGADVALLIRRCRLAFGGHEMKLRGAETGRDHVSTCPRFVRGVGLFTHYLYQFGLECHGDYGTRRSSESSLA
jgi:ATP-dependent helicase YprA (DUF1998 family)